MRERGADCTFPECGCPEREQCRPAPTTAPAQNDAADPWHPIETAPKDGRYVFVHYLNSQGKSRIVKAMFAAQFAVPANEGDELDHDYCEQRDEYFAPEGWYEIVDNWDDFSFIAFSTGHVPDAWMPMPAPPKGGQ